LGKFGKKFPRTIPKYSIYNYGFEKRRKKVKKEGKETSAWFILGLGWPNKDEMEERRGLEKWS
jgi:hypothetical protein